MNSAKSNLPPGGPAKIDPVPEGIHRPFWSVMIPTYNCAKYLVQTLESVLAQDPGPDQMQIEVVDDCSTKDDPEAVVKEIGKGRVGFFRQSKNVGATRNFNTCLEHSHGCWIHILHGDDYVLPGIYDTVAKAIEIQPDAGIVATRVFFVDEDSEIEGLCLRAKSLEKYGKDSVNYTQKNHFQFAGTFLNRNFIEEYGGFDERLVHVSDWEMWVRAIDRRGGIFVNKPYGCYRVFHGNDTSRLRKTAENIKDTMRLREIFNNSIKEFDDEAFFSMVRNAAFDQYVFFRASLDRDAAEANFVFWKSMNPKLSFSQRSKSFAKRVLRKIIR